MAALSWYCSILKSAPALLWPVWRPATIRSLSCLPLVMPIAKYTVAKLGTAPGSRLQKRIAEAKVCNIPRVSSSWNNAAPPPATVLDRDLVSSLRNTDLAGATHWLWNNQLLFLDVWFLARTKQVEQAFLSPSSFLFQSALIIPVWMCSSRTKMQRKCWICIKGVWPEIYGMLPWDLWNRFWSAV